VDRRFHRCTGETVTSQAAQRLRSDGLAREVPTTQLGPDDVVGWPAALQHWTKQVYDEHVTGPQHDELRAELTAEVDAQAAIAR